jgi:hypothetical protein
MSRKKKKGLSGEELGSVDGGSIGGYYALKFKPGVDKDEAYALINNELGKGKQVMRIDDNGDILVSILWSSKVMSKDGLDKYMTSKYG